MTTQAKIAIALALTVIAVFGFLWQIANIRGLRSRGRRRGRDGDAAKVQRKSDTRSLRGAEKRLYTESQNLLAQGKIAPAARILEQLNMPREAIQALEDHGMIHDAAKILMRMQRHNRAGVVYARHGMWENAAQCFKMANMPVEVAKCAREAGDLGMAAEYFEKGGRFEDAGECLEQLGDYHRAARFFSTAGNRPRAMGLYNRLAVASQNLSAIQFEENEIVQIVDYLGDGNTEAGLADVAVNRNKLTEVIINLVTKGLVKQAGELLLRSTSDIGPMLMAGINYQAPRAADCLAEMFFTVSQFHYAGMVFERMNAFERAGESFERAEDFARAAYCFERAGVDFKVKALKEKARNMPQAQRRDVVPPRGGGFALANVHTSGGSERSSTRRSEAPADDEELGDEEKTSILALPNAPNLPPPPKRSPAPLSFSLRDADHDDDKTEDDNDSDTENTAHSDSDDDGGDTRESVSDGDDNDNDNDGDRGNRAPQHAPSAKAVDADEWPPRGRAPRSEPPMALKVDAKPISKPETRLDDKPETPASKPDASVTLEEGRAAFHKASFFADLDFEQKNKLWNIGKTLNFGADETVLTYNDEPKGVYVIVQGSVSCYRQVNAKEAYVDQMGESESFGELWLLADQPTAVRFVASKNTRIRVIDRSAFNDLLDADGMIARKLYKRFTMRLLKRLLKPQPTAVAPTIPPAPSRGQKAS